MTWESDGRGQKAINEIAAAVKRADTLYLATDPDREGEAISWHVQGALDARKALAGKTVHRITFNEITKAAVKHAVANPRAIDAPLVHAYLARRALDYLFGYTLSPVLWRKLPGSKSAGRVQSVALRLICDREAEIEVFRPREYWTVEADFLTPAGKPFTAKLSQLEGKKLDQFDLAKKDDADKAVAAIEAAAFTVASVETKRTRRNPPAPFMTSTLQMEASRKLRFGAKRTMQLAQKLYEGVDIGGETVGLHYLYAHRRRADGTRGHAVDPRPCRPGVREAVPAAGAPRIHHQGQERPGSARGDPPHGCGPYAGKRGALPG